jgi:hypothetical protein
MISAVFEPAILARDRLQIHVFDGATNGMVSVSKYSGIKSKSPQLQAQVTLVKFG